MAKRLGIGMRKLLRLELGREPVEIQMDVPELLSQLAVYEQCRVQRRRAGISRTEMAKLIRVSPWWLTRMENGEVAPDKLARYWNLN